MRGGGKDDGLAGELAEVEDLVNPVAGEGPASNASEIGVSRCRRQSVRIEVIPLSERRKRTPCDDIEPRSAVSELPVRQVDGRHGRIKMEGGWAVVDEAE